MWLSYDVLLKQSTFIHKHSHWEVILGGMWIGTILFGIRFSVNVKVLVIDNVCVNVKVSDVLPSTVLQLRLKTLFWYDYCF